MTTNYQTAADIFDNWRDDVLTSEPPILYPVGTGELAHIEIGPGLVTLVGGPPGAGKTALVMQWVIDGLRLSERLRVLVCNVEMPPQILLDRTLSRLSGIDLTTVRHRRFEAAHSKRLDRAINTIEHLADRLCFVQPPFDLQNVAAAADSFDAGLLVLDYIQRIPPPGEHGDRRSAVDATMNYLRRFAAEGVAVIVVAAVARQKDNKGRSSYAAENLSLASFRESSELEFGADDAFILCPSGKNDDIVTLRHLKARYSDPRDLELRFDGARQAFASVNSIPTGSDLNREVQEDLRDLWGQTEPADKDMEDDGND